MYKIQVKKQIEDANWFLVNLAEPLKVNEQYQNKKILLKIKDTFASLVHDEHIKCWLKLIPVGHDPAVDRDISNYPGLGHVMINGEDYEYDVA